MTTNIRDNSSILKISGAGFHRMMWPVRRFCHRIAPRLFLGHGIGPIGVAIDGLPGQPIHRYYLEQFIDRHRNDIKGHCLEFQDSFYSSRYGDGCISKLDIINLDDTAPEATIVADLTRNNGLASNQFDSIICTHVLEVVEDLDRFTAELHRILKPGGVLFVAVPHILYNTNRCGELWRFTNLGLKKLLVKHFGEKHLTITGYGNSLTAAGDIRGLVAQRFSHRELDCYDSRYVIEVCARIIKEG